MDPKLGDEKDNDKQRGNYQRATDKSYTQGFIDLFAFERKSRNL